MEFFVLFDDAVDRMLDNSLSPVLMIVPKRRDALSFRITVISSGLVLSLYSFIVECSSLYEIGQIVLDVLADPVVQHGSKNSVESFEMFSISCMIACSAPSSFAI